MSFDLQGLDPANGSGERYSRSAWSWRPLWKFLSEKCSDILTPHQVTLGHENSGCVISKEQAAAIGARLDEIIKAGGHHTYAAELAQFLSMLPDETCYMCKGTGQRSDAWFSGTCNVCKGKGQRRPDDCSYVFTIENLMEFHEFVKNSRGFEIW